MSTKNLLKLFTGSSRTTIKFNVTPKLPGSCIITGKNAPKKTVLVGTVKELKEQFGEQIPEILYALEDFKPDKEVKDVKQEVCVLETQNQENQNKTKISLVLTPDAKVSRNVIQSRLVKFR